MATKITKVRRKLRKVQKRYFTLQPKLKFHYGWYYKHAKVNEKQMVFESFHGKTVSDSPLHILQAFLERPESSEYTIYYTTANMKEHRELVKALGLPVKLIDINSRAYPYVLATSKYLVNNSSFPAYFISRDDQTYLQTWHGTPMKTLGKEMRLGIESMYNVQHNFLQADYITHPNDFTREIVMRDYNLEELYTGTVAMTGYPRNDVFMRDTERGRQIREKYELDKYTTFAYMPTWRGVSNHDVQVASYISQLEEMLEILDSHLRDDQRIFVNFHSMVAAQVSLSNYKHIVSFPADEDNYEFLNQMDALISDYSSVFVDYSITRKPIILFMYDLEEYLHDRGLPLDYDELPFQKLYTIEDLVDSIETGSYKEFTYEGSDYEERFLKYDRPDNAERSLDLLFGNPPADMPLISYEKNTEQVWNVLDPYRVKTSGDIDTISKVVDAEKDIVVLPRSGFTQELSAHLHDNYRNDFTFMFITRTVPRTYVEDVTKRFSEKTEKALAEREKRRVFDALQIGEINRELYCGEAGTTVRLDGYTGVNATVESNSEALTIHLHEEAMQLQRIMLLSGSTVIWSREVTEQEIETSTVRESFIDALRLGYDPTMNKEHTVGLGVLDLNTGKEVFRVVMQDNAGKSKKDDRKDESYSPVYLDRDALPSEIAENSSFLRSIDEAEPIVLPYYSEKNQALSVIFSGEGMALQFVKKALLKSVYTGDDGAVRIIAKVRGENAGVLGMTLKYRSKSELIEYDLPVEVSTAGGWTKVVARFDFADFPFKEVYWDVFVDIDTDGVSCGVPVICSQRQRGRFKRRNRMAKRKDGNVLIPYVARGDRFAFMFREESEYDTWAVRMKEFAALAVYTVGYPYWHNTRRWLVYEKFCNLAQDNAYYFFKYCMEEVPEKDHKHVYYVIDKRSFDYERVKEYDSHVLQFMSFKHMLYGLGADIVIASDSLTHLYQWRARPSHVGAMLRRRKIFFLQHGVTAMKKVDYLFGKQGTSPMTYFLTTSENEQKIAVEQMGYGRDNAPVLGFSRWDVLEDKSDAANPMILMMPTWRPWLEEQSDDVFVASEYFRFYSAFMQSKELADFLERNNATLKFYIHPKLASFIGNFASEDGSRVELIPMGSEPLNELMMQCSALITDYSSVAWDVLYMDKPVVYSQFDQQEYLDIVGSFIDFDTDLPGDVCKDIPSIVDALQAVADRGFKLTDEQEEIASHWFAYRDKDNRRRTFGFLMDHV